MWKFVKNLALTALTALGLISVQAHAALPAAVSTAITDATTDGVALGGLFLTMAVLVGVLFWLKRKAG